MAQILVVEDDALIAFVVEEGLADAGHKVIVAPNADRALAILDDNEDIDVLFTDIDMPGSMDGLGLAAVVRDRWPPVKIVIASGKRRPSDGDMPGGARFLPKPYLTSEVLNVIHRIQH